MFGMRKMFHMYFYSRRFTILTDHKTLLGILEKPKGIPQMLSPRVQHWVLTLTAYNYELKYKKDLDHQHADAHGKLPEGSVPNKISIPGEVVVLMEYLDGSPISTQQLATLTRCDPIPYKIAYFNRGRKENV